MEAKGFVNILDGKLVTELPFISLPSLNTFHLFIHLVSVEETKQWTKKIIYLDSLALHGVASLSVLLSYYFPFWALVTNLSDFDPENQRTLYQ